MTLQKTSITNRLSQLLELTRHRHGMVSELQAFAPWPKDLSQAKIRPDLSPNPVAMITTLKAIKTSDPIITALQDLADHLPWKQSYTETEVGRDFLENYGFIELFGPDGIFPSSSCRGFIGFWGEGLYYPPHHHAAEEIYLVLHGTVTFGTPDDDVTFGTPGQENKSYTTGDVRWHAPHQIHDMQVGGQPFITLALWQGKDMAAPPKIDLSNPS